MKRGKRQVVEKSNLFDDEQSGSTVENITHNNNAFTEDSWSGHEEPKHDKHKNTIQIKKQAILQQNGSQIREPVQQNKSHSREAVNGDNVTGGNDDRKKRLDMLKNKYLKAGSSTVQHNQQPIKHQPKKYQSAIDSRQHNVQSQASNNFIDAFEDRRQIKQEESPINSNKVSKTENEPISKPTQTSSTRKPVPPPPTNTRGKPPPPPLSSKSEHEQMMPSPASTKNKPVPPPLPSTKPIPAHTSHVNQNQHQHQQQQEQHIKQHQQREQQKHEHNSPKQIKSPRLKQLPSFPKIPHPSNIRTPLSSYNPHFSNVGYEKDDMNLQQIVKHWLTGTSYYHSKNRPDMTDIVQAIAAEISAGSGTLLRGIVKTFVLANQARYSQQQINILTKQVLTRNQLSCLAKLFISVKCGPAVLLQYCSTFLENPTQLLPQIRQLKSNFLPIQLSQLSKILLTTQSIAPQTSLHHIAYLAPNSPSLTQHVLNHQFHSSSNAALVLCQLRNCIQQNQCSMYFRLINRVVSDISDQKVLQDIIAHIGNVQYNSAYQIKKQMKLKIIQKIDRCANGTVPQFDTRRQQMQAQNQPAKKHVADSTKAQSKDTDKQKGLGLNNFMGYFNQALKKITNQAPEKQQPTTGQGNKVQQEPKETFAYDPVLKRYLINGKVPQDQYGNTVIDTEDNNNQDEKPKKKVPPPPPRIGNRKNESKKQETQYIVQPTNDIQPQPLQDALEQEQSPVPKPSFPVPRVGLKGMANKKPKIQARYA